MFTIEKNVPIETGYPFRNMQIGDSFVIKTVRRGSCMVAYKYNVGLPKGFKLKSKSISDTECRVWRIE